MKLYLQNKLISLGESSYVLDEAGKNFFQVNGKVVSPTRKKFLCDLQGNTLYMIRNKYWHFFTHSAFICDGNGQKNRQDQRKILRRIYAFGRERRIRDQREIFRGVVYLQKQTTDRKNCKKTRFCFDIYPRRVRSGDLHARGCRALDGVCRGV